MAVHPIQWFQNGFAWAVGVIGGLVRFLKEAFQETGDDGTSKASFGRIFGGLVVWRIIHIAEEMPVRPVPDSLFTLFYWLIGYTLLSKLSPPVFEIVKLMYTKAIITTTAKANADATS